MFRKFYFTSAAIAALTLLFACAVVNGQSQPRPSATPAPTPTPAPQNQSIKSGHYAVSNSGVLEPETDSAKGWDGKVQGRVLVTPVVVTFTDPQDYDHIVSGEIRLNLILKNTLSGQTVRLDGRQLREGLRPGSDKSRLTVNVIVDNMSAPLSEAACGMITPSAENSGDDVNITLSYSACGSQPAQRPGNPIGGIVVHGGKHPHGDMSIVLGGSETAASSEAYLKLKINPSSNGGLKRMEANNVIILSSSKGTGSPKANGF